MTEPVATKIRRITATNHALEAVANERERQERLKAEGRFPHTCADSAITDEQAFVILGEEFGEVARAVLEKQDLANDKHGVDLRKELVQVAAVCVAWVEKLSRS